MASRSCSSASLQLLVVVALVPMELLDGFLQLLLRLPPAARRGHTLAFPLAARPAEDCRPVPKPNPSLPLCRARTSGSSSRGGDQVFFGRRSMGPTWERNPTATTVSRTHQWNAGCRMPAAVASQLGHRDGRSRGDQSAAGSSCSVVAAKWK